MTGFADQTYRPERAVTRAQFTVMLARALGIEPRSGGVPAGTFADQASLGEWASGHVAVMLEHGLIAGYEDGTFRPEASVTRTEVAVLIARALHHRSLPVEPAPELAFVDRVRIPDWATSSIRVTVAARLVGGFADGSFRPGETATRAEVAAIINRFRGLMTSTDR